MISISDLLFKKSNYKQVECLNNIEKFEKEDEKGIIKHIDFDKINKIIDSYSTIGNEEDKSSFLVQSLTPQEVYAIYEKIKELDWLK